MVGLYLGTGEARWRENAEKLTDLLVRWHDEYGGLLAPYTSHSMPRVPFMIALTVNSLARYLLIKKDKRVEELIVHSVDDVVEHCLGPDGIFYYKELPSLRRPAPTNHMLEALTHAYRITKDEKYLKLAARQYLSRESAGRGAGWGGAKYIDGSGAVIVGSGGARSFADSYASILLFAGEAGPKGFLKELEYPF